MSKSFAFGQYFGGLKKMLMPIVSVNQISTSLDNIRDEVKTKVLPTYTRALYEANLYVGTKPFKSPWAISKNKLMMETPSMKKVMSGDAKRNNCLYLIHGVLSRFLVNVDTLQKYIAKHIRGDIATDQLTYQHANIIRLAESAEFMAQYSRRFLMYITTNEYNLTVAEEDRMEPFQPVFINWLEKNLASYMKLLALWGRDSKDFLLGLEILPEVVIPSTQTGEDEMRATYGNKLDSMGMGFIPIAINPIYYVRNVVLHWRNYRVESAKNEAMALEFELECYMSVKAGKPLSQEEKEVLSRMEENVKKANAKYQELNDSFLRDYGLDD